MRDRPPLDVLIAGGGCAALEAMFRLQRIAGNSIQTSVLAPDEHFTDHALDVLVPFVGAHAPRAALAELTRAAGAQLRQGRMAAADVDAHHVLTDGGELIAYDALLIAVGALQRQPAAHTLCFGSEDSQERMHGLIQDLETGYVQRIAFVVPATAAWPVALYELALMAAERAYALCQHGELTVLTAEPAPLAIFGPQVSRALTAKLQAAGVTIRTAVDAEVRAAGLVVLHPGGEQLTVDRIVTVPVLDGPALDGLPHDAHGFSRSMSTAACSASQTSTPPATSRTIRSSTPRLRAGKLTQPLRRSPPRRHQNRSRPVHARARGRPADRARRAVHAP
jgi:sulfide:quinone oxidoreductase